MKTGLTFGQALEALHNGQRVARGGWNGKELFVFRQVPADIGMDVVPKMQSLPDSVKAEFQARYANCQTSDDPRNSIHYRNQLAMVHPDNTITGWAPSASDALAVDWIEFDPTEVVSANGTKPIVNNPTT